MSDTIYRQAAIDAIKILCRNYAKGKSTFHPHMDFVIEQLRWLPSAQQWIPCSERLPDVAQRVLLSGHGQVMVGMLHSSGKYSLEPTGIAYVYPKDDIEAWMPLPESYSGE